MSALRFPSRRVWVWPLFLVLGGWGLALGQAEAQPPPGRGAAPPDKQEKRVFALRYASAPEVARVLRQLFDTPGGRGGRLAIGVDDRTNSVILSGAPADLVEAEAILTKIDTEGPPPGAGASQLRLFALRHRGPDATLEAALRMLVEGRRGRYVVDRNRRQVLLYADQGTSDLVEALLSRLDVPPEGKPEPAGTDLEVRVFWVVAGPVGKGEAKALDDFKEATAELARLGIDKPRLAAEVAVTTVPGGRFEMTGAASLDTPCRLAVTGTLADGKDGAGLEISITATRAAVGQDGGPLCRLRTQVTAPLGRPLVLGVTPTGTLKSAFVVKVERPQPPALPGKLRSFEFRDAPWSQVLEWLGDQTGMPVIMSDFKPTGTFTFIPPSGGKNYSTREVLDTLNEALLQQNCLLIRRAGSYAVDRPDRLTSYTLQQRPLRRAQDLEEYPTAQWVSLVVPLKSLVAEDVASKLKKMLTANGEAVALPDNKLLLSDTVGSLRHIRQVLDDLEKIAKK